MALFEAKHIAASYSQNGETVQLFSDVSFGLEEGRIYDLVGPSGSGKSTLLRVCALMLDRSAGELYLDGTESAQFGPTQWRREVSLVPQKPALISGSVRDNLLLPWKMKVRAGQPKPTDEFLTSLIKHAELTGIDLDRDVSQLSGGQAARIALLRVFATKPRVMLLDEVDAALDDESAYAIGRMTNHLVGEGLCCMRIRHRSADGFAWETFELKDGRFSRSDGAAKGQGALADEGVGSSKRAAGFATEDVGSSDQAGSSTEDVAVQSEPQQGVGPRG